MRTGFMVCVALGTILVGGSRASADIIRTTVIGTIVSGSNDGIFGATSDLTGARYKAVYEFDDDVGTRNTLPGFFDAVEGGTFYSVTSPVVSSFLKIDGVKAYTDGIQAGVDAVFGSLGLVQLKAKQNSPGAGYQSSYVDDEFYANNVPYSLDTSFSSLVRAGSDQDDAFLFAQGSAYSSGILNPTSIRVQILPSADFGNSPTAAPEPSTWAFLIAGLGGIGLKMRRAARTVGSKSKAALAV